MQPYQIASTPLLRTVVEAIPYSPMAHHLVWYRVRVRLRVTVRVGVRVRVRVRARVG